MTSKLDSMSLLHPLRGYSKPDSIQSLIDNEGFKRKQINGVRCLVNGYFVIPDSRSEYFTPENLIKVVEKLGKPYKYHGINGNVVSLEMYEEVA